MRLVRDGVRDGRAMGNWVGGTVGTRQELHKPSGPSTLSSASRGVVRNLAITLKIPAAARLIIGLSTLTPPSLWLSNR